MLMFGIGVPCLSMCSGVECVGVRLPSPSFEWTFGLFVTLVGSTADLRRFLVDWLDCSSAESSTTAESCSHGNAVSCAMQGVAPVFERPVPSRESVAFSFIEGRSLVAALSATSSVGNSWPGDSCLGFGSITAVLAMRRNIA